MSTRLTGQGSTTRGMTRRGLPRADGATTCRIGRPAWTPGHLRTFAPARLLAGDEPFTVEQVDDHPERGAGYDG